jgi:acetoin utilization protein AcuB
MLVKTWMSRPAITAAVDAMLVDAMNLLQKHEIHRLPVMDGVRLVGILTDHDFKKDAAAYFTSSTSNGAAITGAQKAVGDIMTPNPVTISENQTIADTAELLLVHSVSGLPVVNQAGEVAGMITKSDIFRFIITTIGMGKGDIQIALELVDRPGRVKEVTDIMRDYGGRIGTVISTRERAGKGCRKAYIRLYDIDRPGLARLREVLQEKVKVLYIINQREKMGEIS